MRSNLLSLSVLAVVLTSLVTHLPVIIHTAAVTVLAFCLAVSCTPKYQWMLVLNPRERASSEAYVILFPTGPNAKDALSYAN